MRPLRERDDFWRGTGRWAPWVTVLGPVALLLLLFTPVGWGILALAFVASIPAGMVWAWLDRRRERKRADDWRRAHGYDQ